MGHFTGQVVVITGAGGGIGRCHALAFAREGARVVINDWARTRDGVTTSTNSAEGVVQEIVDMGGEAVADTHSVATVDGATAIMETAIQAFGQVDVVINNAGILRDRTLKKMTMEEWPRPSMGNNMVLPSER